MLHHQLILKTSLIFVFTAEEKLVALLFFSSFRQVATSNLQRNSVFACSGIKVNQTERQWRMNTILLPTRYSLTAQLTDRIDLTSPD